MHDNLEKDYAHWKRVLQSDEREIRLLGHRDAAHVWIKKGETNPKNTVPTVKHGGGSFILWNWEPHQGEGIVKKEGYMKVLIENLKQSGANWVWVRHLVFQHIDDSKHALLQRDWPKKNGLGFLWRRETC